MKPRTGSRALADSPAAVVVEPYDVSGPLPEWAPPPPRCGWTPATAWAASKEYAAEHVRTDGGPTEHRLSRCAFRALCVGVPGLHRAWMIERLQGVDVTAA